MISWNFLSWKWFSTGIYPFHLLDQVGSIYSTSLSGIDKKTQISLLEDSGQHEQIKLSGLTVHFTSLRIGGCLPVAKSLLFSTNVSPHAHIKSSFNISCYATAAFIWHIKTKKAQFCFPRFQLPVVTGCPEADDPFDQNHQKVKSSLIYVRMPTSLPSLHLIS